MSVHWLLLRALVLWLTYGWIIHIAAASHYITAPDAAQAQVKYFCVGSAADNDLGCIQSIFYRLLGIEKKNVFNGTMLISCSGHSTMLTH